ncbi:putative DNA primase protein [Rhizobium phage RHph_Y1_20]|uniref:Putative DNA primase protein n=1 Tax=Rhizobium phage RHph_Y1_20 TaxID=2509571 RepID=A0A7S5QYF3_9CAUD|nr:putative DNA primase protein [Rhizobium phage RHph_Y1_20]
MRIECCSADRSMLLGNTRKGYTGYCFRCKEPMFQPHGEFSLAVLARRKAELALVQERLVQLPRDFTLEIPTDEAVWLYKAGISSEIARYYGIGWSEYLGRVIVPTYEHGELVAYTARLQHGKPKYIEKSVDPTGCVFVASPALLLPSYRDWAHSQGPDAVLVEDNLSAIRVGRVARHVVSLMGTSANARQLSKALAGHKGLRRDAMGRVVVWLDPDKPGRSASSRVCQSLRLLGYEVHEVVSERDPKLYANRDIKEFLSIDRHSSAAAD